jgi:hypothetical protein
MRAAEHAFMNEARLRASNYVSGDTINLVADEVRRRWLGASVASIRAFLEELNGTDSPRSRPLRYSWIGSTSTVKTSRAEESGWVRTTNPMLRSLPARAAQPARCPWLVPNPGSPALCAWVDSRAADRAVSEV